MSGRAILFKRLPTPWGRVVEVVHDPARRWENLFPGEAEPTGCVGRAVFLLATAGARPKWLATVMSTARLTELTGLIPRPWQEAVEDQVRSLAR